VCQTQHTSPNKEAVRHRLTLDVDVACMLHDRCSDSFNTNQPQRCTDIAPLMTYSS
jgi:hypothetical protein